MIGFIYIIKNTVNSKVYIGQTKVDVETRWKEHLRHAKYGKYVINKAMRKYGTDKFYVETLEICDFKVIDEREKYYISLYDSTNKSKGYNVSIGGKTPSFERIILPIQVLIDLYKHCSISEISSRTGISKYLITTELRNAGIQIKSRSEVSTKFKSINKEVIINALTNSKSLREAAKFASIPYPTFRKACIYHNVEYNSSTSARHLKE